ncbi:MSHA biogenesis protein MshP [Agarivorans gilvus]|uniref:MSHA biogenesis protein MshP n=1 Tax=Agarivorans gilvus TaxID=680279 RepID=UPI000B1B39EE|nr:MSHA biogenesis protein MshP [Agarivorans gilvus]
MISSFLINPRRQSGSALLVAIFVIVVMALLTAGLTTILRDSSRNAAWEVLGARAELAASSALEQALFSLFPLNPASPLAMSCDDVVEAPALAGPGFATCKVKLSCQQRDVLQLAARFYDLDAVAECGEGEVRVQRQQVVQARTVL